MAALMTMLGTLGRWGLRLAATAGVLAAVGLSLLYTFQVRRAR